MVTIKQSVHEDFEKLRENRAKYFTQFYNNNFKLVYRICFSVLKNNENSEDIAQSVFEKIYKMPNEKYPTNFESSWLYTVAKNESLQFIRKNNKKNEEIELENIKSDDNQIDDVISQENYDNMVKKLNKKQEQIVSLKVVSEFTFREIGQIMSMPTATVQWYYYSSIKSLKLALSNLAMFMIAFIVGVRLYRKNEKIQDETQSTNHSDKVTSSELQIQSSDSEKSEELDNKNVNNESINIENFNSENTVNKETVSSIVINHNVTDDNSYVYAFSISGIFLILTIIFSIFFIKNQQKKKTNTSKK